MSNFKFTIFVVKKMSKSGEGEKLYHLKIYDVPQDMASNFILTKEDKEELVKILSNSPKT